MATHIKITNAREARAAVRKAEAVYGHVVMFYGGDGEYMKLNKRDVLEVLRSHVTEYDNSDWFCDWRLRENDDGSVTLFIN